MTVPPTPFPEPGPDIRLTLPLSWEEAERGTVRTLNVYGRPEEVSIPAGVTDGRELRLPGRGGPSPGGGPAGALVVALQVAPPPARGGDIRRTLRVTWEEAGQGGTRPLTVDGRTLGVALPPGVRDGHVLRLAGEGSSGLNGAPAGDLIVTLQVMPPQAQGLPQPPPRANVHGDVVPGPIADPYVDPYSAPPSPQRGEDVRLDLPLTSAQARAGGMHGIMAGGQRLDVPVPYGAADGQELRRGGGGVPGRNGGPPGDLVVTVRVPQAAVTPPASGPRWLIPVGVIAAVIVLGILFVHFARPWPPPPPAPAAVDYSQMQFWKTLPPPGGAADPHNPDSSYAMAFAPNDTLVVGYFPNTEASVPQVCLWNVQAGTATSPADMGNTSWLNVHDIAVSPNGQNIAVGGYDYRHQKIYLVEYLINGSEVAVEDMGVEKIATLSSVVYSPNGRFIAVSCGDPHNKPGFTNSNPAAAKPRVTGNMTVWDATGATDKDLASSDGGDAWYATFLPDSLHVIYGENENLFEYPLQNDGGIGADHPTTVCDKQDTNVGFTQIIPTADGQGLYVLLRQARVADIMQKLNATTGVDALDFSDKTGKFAFSSIQKIALSPDGRCLAAAGVDSTKSSVVTLWDTQTGALVCPPLAAHDNQTYTVAFSRDGHVLACGSNDGSVKLWRVP